VYGTEQDGIVYGMMIWYGTGQMLQNQRETVLTVQPCGTAIYRSVHHRLLYPDE
jgi:hypothetical protein